MFKKSAGKFSIFILLVSFGLSCSKSIQSFIGETDKKEMVNLPSDVLGSDADVPDLDEETSMILILTSENKLYQEQNHVVSGNIERSEKIITKEELSEKLKKFYETMSSDNKIVYLKSDINTEFDNTLEIFQMIRDAKIRKVGLVTVKKNSESDERSYGQLDVQLPEKSERSEVYAKPNPLVLVAKLETDGKLTLNSESLGTISNTRKFEELLSSVFKERESNGVFRIGTNEVEKTVFLNIARSSKYGDFVKLVDSVKLAGARPVEIQFEDRKLDALDSIDIIQR